MPTLLILYLCLVLCSYSSYGLSVRAAFEQAPDINMERPITTRVNSSFIQQIIPWHLSFLMYKALFIMIPIIMVCLLYENGDNSLQQAPSKPHEKRIPSSKKHPSGQQQKSRLGSSGSPGPSEKRAKSSGMEEVRIEAQPSQINGGKQSETLQQTPKSSSSSETDELIITLAQKLPKRRKKPVSKNSNAKMEPSSWRKIVKDRDGKLEASWVSSQHRGKEVYVYDPNSKGTGQRGPYPISKMTVLRNAFIPLQNKNVLWVDPMFYTSSSSELKALSRTCKSLYLKFKQLPDTQGKIRANSYMRHPAYMSCVLDLWARNYLICGNREGMFSFYFKELSEAFERYYKGLLDLSNNGKPVSYESFRKVLLFDNRTTIYTTSIKHFLMVKFLEKDNWTYEEVQSSKNTLEKELKQLADMCVEFSNCQFIPPVDQGMDQGSYEIFLKRMKLKNVPFCDCPNISQLLISSQEEPLKLFLFWDMFNGVKVETLFRVPMEKGTAVSFSTKDYIVGLGYDIARFYSSQNRAYLREIYSEMVHFIEQDFFGNNELYVVSQPEQDNLIAFDDYMLDIGEQVKVFLATVVFTSPLATIKI